MIRYEAFRMISIHAPVKGATAVNSTGSKPLRHFNPRSREGSDSRLWGQAADLHISIHAPVKGATCPYVVIRWLTFSFQSTLP